MNIAQSQNKNSGFRLYILQAGLILQSIPWIFEFRITVKLFPEQIQNSGIFRTRVISEDNISVNCMRNPYTSANIPCETLA